MRSNLWYENLQTTEQQRSFSVYYKTYYDSHTEINFVPVGLQLHLIIHLPILT
jgi:hypothetical protein